MYVTKIRKYTYILSLLLILPGLVSLFIQGLNLGVDFTGIPHTRAVREPGRDGSVKDGTGSA